MRPVPLFVLAIAGVVTGWSAAPGAASAQVADDGRGCTAMISQPWTVAGGKTYRIVAAASGRSCVTANVTLTIRAMPGKPAAAPLLTFSSAAADLPLVFGEATRPAAMTSALRQWIKQPSTGRTTRDLPTWAATEDAPHSGDMAFEPEPPITRERYAELRKLGQPAFCFVQGAESEACYALDPEAGTLLLIGIQMLPG